ncbi:class I SAM-dependent methyltransferase [Fervidibacillus halotolerans]|uniref:SAM-dependent methyltransferase n=1 Tax=Fervidibacillus halotolerans TaxID=2980027 RepID=A0A9E8LXW5_9BACI|nr:SAM-dependent methyltransferase [Fervidibacillus halotolerans]WAA11452.1 SAM-dependent methyltransferase [Fervidibacillus halotolerans]
MGQVDDQREDWMKGRWMGPMVSYEQWIEDKLYHPKNGYYMTKKEKIGKRADFYTAAEFFPIFATLMANYFIQKVEENRLPPIFCEIGSGTGKFMVHFVTHCKKRAPHFFKDFQYISVEKSPYHRQLQRSLVQDDQVLILEDLEHLEPFEGMMFMNEFFDALPVHVIEKRGNTIFEIWVSSEGGKVSEQKLPLQNERIIRYLKRFPNFTIQDGHRVEIPLRMEEMYRKLAERLKRGYMIIIDYGYTFFELNRANLKNGSLRAYRNHRLIKLPSVMNDIDITSHIHFDALMEWGRELGLQTVEFLTQREFLIKIGIFDALVDHEDRTPFSKRWKRNAALRSLISEEGMGELFHVIVQKKTGMRMLDV